MDNLEFLNGGWLGLREEKIHVVFGFLNMLEEKGELCR